MFWIFAGPRASCARGNPSAGALLARGPVPPPVGGKSPCHRISRPRASRRAGPAVTSSGSAPPRLPLRHERQERPDRLFPDRQPPLVVLPDMDRLAFAERPEQAVIDDQLVGEIVARI